MNRGYAKVWRKITETSFYKKSYCAHLALHLLLECNHEPKKFMFNGNEVVLERGQCITGLFRLSSSTGISIRSLRTALHALSNAGFLTSKTTNRYRVISIVNYDKYQSEPTSSLTSHRQATDNQTTTNNNYKNDKNIDKAPAFVLPEWIDEPTWDAFLEGRRAKKAPNTTHPLNLVVAKLDSLRSRGHDPKAVLEQSIIGGWAGVFELKNTSTQKGAPARSNPQYDEAQENKRQMEAEKARQLPGGAK